MPPYFDLINGANLQRLSSWAIGSTSTAGYCAPNPPPVRQTPSHIVVDRELPQKMQGSLRSYLAAKPGLPPKVSPRLATRLDLTQQDLAQNLPRLTGEPAARDFFVRNV